MQPRTESIGDRHRDKGASRPVTARPDLAEHRALFRAPVRPAAKRAEGLVRPAVRGKFLFVGDEKLYVRGATYGTFRPNSDGELYPEPTVVERDFARMAKAGFNAVRTYTLPPRWLLDLAADHGLYVMVGIAWEQHVDFLEERWRARSIADRVRAGVAACAGHPAVLCYAVGNEIPGQIVRWLGRRPVEPYIEQLYDAAKEEDPGGLVTYVNYPPTEYLQLPCAGLRLLQRLSRGAARSGRLPCPASEHRAGAARAHGGDRPGQLHARRAQAGGRPGLADPDRVRRRAAPARSCSPGRTSGHSLASGGRTSGTGTSASRDVTADPKPALEAVATAFEEAPFGPGILGRSCRSSYALSTASGRSATAWRDCRSSTTRTTK